MTLCRLRKDVECREIRFTQTYRRVGKREEEGEMDSVSQDGLVSSSLPTNESN